MNPFKQVSVLKIIGEQSHDFVKNLTIGSITDGINYNAICSPKGRILFSMFGKLDQNQILLATDDKLLPQLLNFLQMRTFRMQLELIHDPSIKLLINNKKNKSTSANCFPELKFGTPTANATTASIWEFVFQHQLPWITEANQERFIPQQLNLDKTGVIDFKKGCYPGQEIIAKMHYLGKTTKRMRLFSSENKADLEQQKAVAWCSPMVKIGATYHRQGVVAVTSNQS